MTEVHNDGKDWVVVLKGSEISGRPRPDNITRIGISLSEREIESFEYTKWGIYINLSSTQSKIEEEK